MLLLLLVTLRLFEEAVKVLLKVWANADASVLAVAPDGTEGDNSDAESAEASGGAAPLADDLLEAWSEEEEREEDGELELFNNEVAACFRIS